MNIDINGYVLVMNPESSWKTRGRITYYPFICTPQEAKEVVASQLGKDRFILETITTEEFDENRFHIWSKK